MREETNGIDDIKVLLVDDSREYARITSEFLERENKNIEVLIEVIPRKALETIKEKDIDCIVSDYQMPQMHGIELLKKVRKDNPDLPFILFTGKGSEEVASDAISAGVTDYLQKQVGSDQYKILANRIDNAVSSKRMKREGEMKSHRLEQILKTVPSCIVQINYNGKFIYANDRAKEVLGLQKEDVRDRTYNDPDWSITDLDGDPIPDEKLPFRQVRDSGEPIYDFQHTIEGPEEVRKVLSVNGAPLFDDEGNVESTIFSLTDITERKERERELESLKIEYETIFSNVEDGLFLIDVEKRGSNSLEDFEFIFRRTNRAHQEISGISSGEIKGKTPKQLLGEKQGEKVEKNYRHCVKKREAIIYGEKLSMPKGDIYWETKLTPVIINDEVKQITGIARDITEQKRREDELRKERKFVQQAIDVLEDNFYFVTPDGKMERYNNSVLEVSGYSEEEIESMDSLEFFKPEDRQKIKQTRKEALETGKAKVEADLLTKNGETIPYEFRQKRFEDENENIIGVVGIGRDISDRKKRKRELERKNERLEKFTSVVSHDLKNPLNVAVINLELAKEEFESENLDKIDNAIKRMEELIDDILTLARQDKDIGQKTSIELSELADRCWKNLQTKNATLNIETEKTIQADKNRLAELLENLFSNSIKHGGYSVTITIGDLKDGFYIEDNGSGIPPEERYKIFETGYTTENKGTGYGLSIVKDIIKAHNWTITVTESSKNGARFEIQTK